MLQFPRKSRRGALNNAHLVATQPPGLYLGFRGVWGVVEGRWRREERGGLAGGESKAAAKIFLVLAFGGKTLVEVRRVRGRRPIVAEAGSYFPSLAGR